MISVLYKLEKRIAKYGTREPLWGSSRRHRRCGLAAAGPRAWLDIGQCLSGFTSPEPRPPRFASRAYAVCFTASSTVIAHHPRIENRNLGVREMRLL